MPKTSIEVAGASTQPPAPTSQQNRLAQIAERSLDFFEEAAGSAREALAEDRRPGASVLAVINTLTADKALQNLESLNEARLRELRVLSIEPAIARIVAEDERGTQTTYFISRATPHLSPRDGTAVASYRAPIGRLAALPVGADMRAIRGRARAVATGRGFSRQTRNGRIIQWLGDRGLSPANLVAIGESLQVQASATPLCPQICKSVTPTRYPDQNDVQ